MLTMFVYLVALGKLKIRLLWLGKLYHYRNHLQLKEKVGGEEGLGEVF